MRHCPKTIPHPLSPCLAAVLTLRKRRRAAALQAERDAPPGMKRAGSTMPFMLNGTGGTVGSQGSLGSGPDGRRGKDYFGAHARGVRVRLSV